MFNIVQVLKYHCIIWFAVRFGGITTVCIDPNVA